MSLNKFEAAVEKINQKIGHGATSSKSTDTSRSSKPFNQSYREVMADIKQRRAALRSNRDSSPS